MRVSPVLEAKAGAKIRQVFQTTNFLVNFFFKNFQKNLLRVSPVLEAKAGAKVDKKSLPANILGSFFKIIYTLNVYRTEHQGIISKSLQ